MVADASRPFQVIVVQQFSSHVPARNVAIQNHYNDDGHLILSA